MIIIRDVRPWTCSPDDSIVEALRRISANRSGVVFAVSDDGVLSGVLTDGDFRRSIINDPTLRVDGPVRSILNTEPARADADAGPEELELIFSRRILHVPLVDDRGRLVGVATTRAVGVELDGRLVDETSPALTIAEIGINHNGSLDRALELVDHAADAGADCAKFQLRDLESLYRNSGQALDANEDLGTQYTLDLLTRFSLTAEELFVAFDRCRERGLIPLCTPWDAKSVEVLEHYGLPGYKVASADLTNHDLLEVVASTGRPVVLSTGMSTEAELIEAVRVLQRRGVSYVLLHCNSTYPAPFRDVNLSYMARLREIGACPVGYSGHERGWHVPVAAVALGARVIEKHITTDRGMEGNDHKVSLLPEEFAQMVVEIRQIEEASGSTAPRTLTQGELMNRVTLAKSLVASRDLPAGHVVTGADLSVKSPGRGIQPNRRTELIGRPVRRSMIAGDFFFDSDLDDDRVEPRPYHFRRPWGLPVRYHDLDKIVARSAPDFVEFHLSYQDLEVDFRDFVTESPDMGFAVHSPDLFRGDHILNLAADDEEYRKRSLHELQRVVDLTREMKPYYPSTECPIVIVSMGGFSSAAPLPIEDRPGLYRRVIDCLADLDDDGVRVVAQTLPPFPWYLGGQLHCNLFVDPDDTVGFSIDSGYPLCFDVSHSKLAANHLGRSFKEFVDIVGPHTAHLHLVDAAGVDGEGLQVGDGEIDWPLLAEQLDIHTPNAAFIPEIWQGHKNEGEDFWIALDRLEKWF